MDKVNLDISKKSCILANKINLNKMNYENFKTGFNKPTIITAQQYGTKVSVEIDHSDTDIDELFDAFQTLVIGLGYHESAWKQWIVDRADEYKEEEIENAVDMGMYEPNAELRRAAEEYVKLMSETQIDEALVEHNAHEEGFDTDNFEDYQHDKLEKGSTYLSVPVNFYIDDDGNKVYDFEGMADQFENQLSELDDSVVVMCSVETKDKPKKKNKKNK